MIFGITVEEFIAIVGAILAIIATIKKLDNKDPILDRSVEAVEEIILLLEKQIKDLTTELTKVKKEYRNFRNRVLTFINKGRRDFREFSDEIE